MCNLSSFLCGLYFQSQRWKGAVEREVKNQGHDERKTRSLVRGRANAIIAYSFIGRLSRTVGTFIFG